MQWRPKLSVVLLICLLGATGCSDSSSFTTTTTTTQTTNTTTNSTTLASIQIAPVNQRIAPNTQIQLFATGTADDGSLSSLTTSATWSSSNPAVATVSNAANTQGRVTAVAAGTTTLTATDSASGISGSVVVTVTSATLQSISVQPQEPPVAANTFRGYTAIGYFSDGTSQSITTSVNWTSSNTSVATLSNTAPNQGIASTLAAGTSTVTATDPSTSLSASTPLYVSSATLQSLQITPSSATLAVGTPVTFTVLGVFSDGTTQNLSRFANLASSNTNVLFISTTPPTVGQSVALAAGTSTVTASYGSLTASTPVTVTSATVSSLAVSPVNPSISVNTTVTLAASAVFTDSSSQTVTNGLIWTSSNPNVAVVSNAPNSQGVVSGLSAGTAVITGTSPNTGATVSTTVTVFSSALRSLSLSDVNPVTPYGVSVNFAAIGTFASNNTQRLSVTWTSSNPAVATIGATGTALPLSAGTTTITATYPATGTQISTTLTVLANAQPTSLTLTPSSSNASIDGPSPRFKLTGNFPDGTTVDLTNSAVWTSSNSGVATISNNPRGQTSLVSTGQTNITASLPIFTTSGTVSTTLTATTALTVTNAQAASLALTSSFNLAPNVVRTVAATETYSDGSTQTVTSYVYYTSSNPSVAVVSNSSKGQVTGISGGTATITAVDPVSGLTNTTTVTVTSASLSSVAISPNAGTTANPLPTPLVPLAGTRQFSVVGTYADNTTVSLTSEETFSSSNPAVAQVDANSGLVTGVTNGTAVITAVDPATGTTVSTNIIVAPEFVYASTGSHIYSFAVQSAAGSATPGALSVTDSFGASSNIGLGTDASGRLLGLAIPNYFLQATAVTTAGTFGATGQSNDAAAASQIVYDPLGQFAFTLEAGNAAFQTITYSGTTFNPVSATTAINGTGPFVMALSPNGRSLVILGTGGTPTLNFYTVSSTGAITKHPNLTFVGAPTEILFDASGKYLYIADPSNQIITTYPFTGSVTGNPAVSAVTLPNNFFTTTAFPTGQMATDDAGKYLYTVGSSGQLMVYSIDAGVLSATGSPYTTSTSPSAVSVDLSGRFVYVLGTNGISAYVINGISGTLTSVSGSPFATDGTAGGSLVVH